MFKHIIVTTDLSPEAKGAFGISSTLAKTFNSKLTLLTVIDTSIQFSFSGAAEMPIVYVPEGIAELSGRIKEQLSAQAREYFPDLTLDCVVRESIGPVHHEISDFARASNADLLVIATHGRSGVKRAILGSVAEQVLRHSGCPVLMVPCAKSTP